MLGDFIYSAETNAASMEAASYKYSAPRKFEKAARRFLLFAAIFVTGGLIWIFAISPCMVPVKTEVKSFAGLDKVDVMKIAGIDSGAAYISVNAGEAEQRLSEYYLVESAKVVKRFPDRLFIFLEPRRAVALTFARIRGRTRPVYFDRHGVVFKIGNEAEAVPAWLPIISGIFDDDQPIELAMRLSSAYLPLLARIEAISDEDAKIWQAISEIGIAKKTDNLFDLVLYPVHDSTRIRMRDDINKDTISYALLMLDVCRRLGDPSVGGVPYEIDVRSGIGVVSANAIAKEASFGK